MEKAPSLSKDFSAFNLGTGIGYTVFEVIDQLERASHHHLEFKVGFNFHYLADRPKAIG